MKPRHKRPFGVTIIALLLLVNGAFAVVRGVEELTDFYHDQRGDIEAGRWNEVTEDLTLSEAITLPLTIFGTVMAWGMWTLQPRAWFLTMALQGIYLTLQLYHYTRGHASYVEMFTSLAIVFYLNQRDVQLVFRKEPYPADTRQALDER
ncbi:hypothetical protein [Aggregatilinea lenta]|uniref:hypothetical protein n=1 Tax=Aggregatilinea lenta TaxID=913108 RepID=UPI0013C347A2|nr:hypothetical protein [Aggregatilinea lenta]